MNSRYSLFRRWSNSVKHRHTVHVAPGLGRRRAHIRGTITVYHEGKIARAKETLAGKDLFNSGYFYSAYLSPLILKDITRVQKDIN